MFGKFGAVGLEFSKEKWLSKILSPLEHSAVFKRSEDLLRSVKKWKCGRGFDCNGGTFALFQKS